MISINSHSRHSMDFFATVIGLIKGMVETIAKLVSWRASSKEAKAVALRERDAHDLLDRFLLVFAALDVPRPLIPKYLKAQHLLTVQQACSDELLLGALTDALLEHTATRLALPTSWLYGTSTARYERYSNYKNPVGVFEALQSMLGKAPGSGFDAELIVVSNRPMDKQPPPDTRVVIFLRQSIDEVEGKDITWVRVVEDDLPWHHGPARMYAKQVILIAMALGVPIRGRSVQHKVFHSFEQGHVFPFELTNIHQGMWHPDDYVLMANESHVAKEVDEAALVRDTCKEHNIFAMAETARAALGRHDLYKRILIAKETR